MDELVAYVRNASETQDNIYTFIHALTNRFGGVRTLSLSSPCRRAWSKQVPKAARLPSEGLTASSGALRRSGSH